MIKKGIWKYLGLKLELIGKLKKIKKSCIEFKSREKKSTRGRGTELDWICGLYWSSFCVVHVSFVFRSP